jgi:DNA/RNA endonuclease YhcR with UshA esterase domain
MMQLITGANTIDISVTENSTIGNPQFVFVFINDNTGRKVACTSTYTELDNNKQRFIITVGASVPLTGSVLFDDYGSYSFYVYQSANAALFNYANINTTDIRTLTGEVGNGKAWWEAPSVTNIYYKDVRTSIVTNGQ